MRKYNFILLLFFVLFRSHAQEIISSNTSIESCVDQKDCRTINNSGYLFYDETKNEFFLKVDFSHFRSETDSLNTWLDGLSDSTLYFKAILAKELFPPQNTQNTKSFKLNGETFFNDRVQLQNVEITIYSTQNSLVISGNNNLKYDAYKLNFSLPIVPKDFKANQKQAYRNQTIVVNITMGRINLLRPGMEFHLKEIYNQSSR